MWLHVENSLGSLTRNDGRRWRYPTFEPPPLSICNQEERTTNSDVIRVGGLEEGRREEKSEEEGEASATSPIRVSIEIILTTSSQQSSGVGWRVMMVSQDSILRLPVFHRMSKDDVEKH